MCHLNKAEFHKTDNGCVARLPLEPAFKHNCFYWVRLNSIYPEWTVAQFYGDGLNYFTVLGADTFYPKQLAEIGAELGYGPLLSED